MIVGLLGGLLFSLLTIGGAVLLGSFVMGPTGKHSEGFQSVMHWVEQFDAQHEHTGRHWAVA